MFIEKISIESFGSLSHKTYDLTEGVNLFRGKNESGKSTLAAFIKFIFYGLSNKPSGKNAESGITEKTRFTNWDTGISGGSLILNRDGERYRIERRLVPAAKASGKESVAIYDLASGAEYRRGECPGEVFFGVNEEVFSQTAFSAQGGGSIVDAEKMNNAIDNLLFSGDESVSVKTALKKLDEARVFLLHKNRKGGKIYALDGEIAELEERIHTAEENERILAAKNRSLSDIHRQLDENSSRLTEIEDKLTHYEAKKILARFEDADRKKADFRAKKETLAKLITEEAVGGFLPDTAYVEGLRSLYGDIGIAEKEEASLALQKEAFAITSLTPAQRSELAAMAACGGRESTAHKLQSAEVKKKNRFRALALTAALTFLFFLTALLLGPLKLLSGPSAALVSSVLFCVAALFALLSIGVYFAARKAAKERKALCDRFSAATPAEALLRVDDAIRAEKIVQESDGRYARLTAALEESRRKVEEGYRKASQLLNKWGLPCSDRLSIAGGADKAQALLLRLNRAETEAREAKMIAESAESALSSYDREEYRQKEERTAYAGEIGPEVIDLLRRNLTFCTKKAEALKVQLRDTELEIASRAALTESTDNLQETLNELRAKRADYNDKYTAYRLAYEAIRQAGDALRARVAPALSQSAGALMKASTQGRYEKIEVDNALNLRFRENDASPTREIGFMSAGTRALTYISLRLSLIRLLFDGKTPPVVFDEAFSSLDDERLSRMMALLSAYAKTSQVILMTCCDREYETAENKNTIHTVEL